MDKIEHDHGFWRSGTRGHQSRLATSRGGAAATCSDASDRVRQVTTWKCWGGKCGEQAVEITALVADWATKSLCSPTALLSARYGIDLRQTQSVLFHTRGGRIPLQRCGRRDFLEIRMTERPCEINAITLSKVKREVEPLESAMRALRTGHLSSTVVRAPWSPEEKRRRETNGHAECDDSCEICVKTRGISRHPGRVHSESCAFDYASVAFKAAAETVTVLTGRGPRGECFCRVVPRKRQRLKELETFLSGMKEIYPSTQVRSDNEEALRHVLSSSCEQTHIDCSNTRIETRPSNGCGENSVRTLKEMSVKRNL